MNSRPYRFVAAGCLALLLSEWLLYFNRPMTSGMGQDFTTMYVGAVLWLHGVDPYQHPDLLPAVARHLGVMQQGVVNSPVILLLDAPLTALGPRTAYLVFIAIQSALIALSVHLLLTCYPSSTARTTRFRTLFWMLTVLSSPLVFLLCYYGQIAGFIAAALSVAIYARARARYGVMGTAIGLTVLKPQLAVLALPLLWGATRRTWVACAAVVVLYAGVIALELSPAGLVNYVHVTLSFSSGDFASRSSDSLGLTSLYRGWLAHGSLRSAIEMAVVIAPLAAGLLILHGARRHPVSLDRARAALAFLGILAMPYSHQYDAIAMMPVIVLGWRSLRPERQESQRLHQVYVTGILFVTVSATEAVSVVPVPYRLSSIGLVLCTAALGWSLLNRASRREWARAA